MAAWSEPTSATHRSGPSGVTSTASGSRARTDSGEACSRTFAWYRQYPALDELRDVALRLFARLPCSAAASNNLDVVHALECPSSEEPYWDGY